MRRNRFDSGGNTKEEKKPNNIQSIFLLKFKPFQKK